MTYEISTSSSAGTQALAARLAKLVKGGDVLELVSDLGGGKTTFVQGLAAGLGYAGQVTSPTFALSQIYRLGPKLELHHYDLYRLSETGVVGSELAEDLDDQRIITAVEWPGLASSVLPADHLRIALEVTSENGRRLTFTSSGPRSRQIIEALKS